MLASPKFENGTKSFTNERNISKKIILQKWRVVQLVIYKKKRI